MVMRDNPDRKPGRKPAINRYPMETLAATA